MSDRTMISQLSGPEMQCRQDASAYALQRHVVAEHAKLTSSQLATVGFDNLLGPASNWS